MKIIILSWGGLNFCNARLNSRRRAKIPTHCGRDCHFSVKNGKAAANCPKFRKQTFEDWQNPSKYRDFLKLQLYRFQKVTPRMTTDFANSIAHVQICCAEPRPRTNFTKLPSRVRAIRGRRQEAIERYRASRGRHKEKKPQGMSVGVLCFLLSWGWCPRLLFFFARRGMRKKNQIALRAPLVAPSRSFGLRVRQFLKENFVKL